VKEYTQTATPADAGGRLDRWLCRCLPELSRSRIQQLIKSGHVTACGRPVKAHQKPVAGTAVHISIPDPEALDLTAEDIPLNVIYEDADIIVVNKQAGMVVHPAAGHYSGTLVNALLGRCRDLPGIGGKMRPGIVHRLDKGTSGALVAAKTERAMAGLARQFKDRAVRKEYLALVWGRPRETRARIETSIGRSRRDRKKMSVNPVAGRNAVTNYETVEVFKRLALLRVRIETGRTHQIRVHLAHLGCPVVGDCDYGGRRGELPQEAERPMLHAERLAFDHPASGKRREFVAPLPADMKKLIGALKHEKKRDKSG